MVPLIILHNRLKNQWESIYGRRVLALEKPYLAVQLCSQEMRVPEGSECDGGCTGCVRLPLQPLLAEGCSLQFALSGYVVNGTSSFLRLPYGLTQGSCVQGLLPMVSFGCCICCLCQAVAAQERDPVGVCVGGYGVAKLLGCSVPCALSLAPPKFCYGSRCSYGPYPGAFCQVWAGESHPDDVDGSRCTA